MSNEKEINGFKIYENCDEAVYAAKSKDDVYDYFVEMYGSTIDCQGETKDQFIDGLIEIKLSSDCANRIRTWHSDDTGEITKSTYYDEYKKVAENNNGVDVIAYLTW